MAADSLSRHFEDGIEWELNRGLFEKICAVFGVPQIDLFASRVNHQTRAYASWKPDPHAAYVDAFSVSWSQFTNSYMFPPFCLVGRCLQKLVLEQATAIIIVPLWTTQTDMVHQPSESPGGCGQNLSSNQEGAVFFEG